MAPAGMLDVVIEEDAGGVLQCMAAGSEAICNQCCPVACGGYWRDNAGEHSWPSRKPAASSSWYTSKFSPCCALSAACSTLGMSGQCDAPGVPFATGRAGAVGSKQVLLTP